MAVIVGRQGEPFAVIEPAPSGQGLDTWAEATDDTAQPA
jgi:hypothetical protein